MADTNRKIRVAIEDKWGGTWPIIDSEIRTVYIPNIEDLTPDPEVSFMNWNGVKGHLQFEGSKKNETFTDLTPWFPIIDEYDRLVDLEDNPPPIPLDEYKEAAKSRLFQYYNEYVSSQFTIGPSTFRASAKYTNMYQSINFFVKETPGSVSYFVVDVADEPFPINNQTAWDTFWGGYKQLFIDARNILAGAWPDVKAATSLVEVDAVFDALPPIPGTE